MYFFLRPPLFLISSVLFCSVLSLSLSLSPETPPSPRLHVPMVVKTLMRIWRPSTPIVSHKRFNVTLSVLSLEGLSAMVDKHIDQGSDQDIYVRVELEWKGSGGYNIIKFGRNSHKKRSFTSQRKVATGADMDGIIIWEEEGFENICVLNLTDNSAFLPFHVQFSIIFQVGSRTKATTLGTCLVNLAEFAPLSEKIVQRTTKLQLFPPNIDVSCKSTATLVVSVVFSEVLSDDRSLRLDRFMPHPLHCLSGPLLCDQQMRENYGKKIKGMKRSISLNWHKNSGELDTIVVRKGCPSSRSDAISVLDIGNHLNSDALSNSEDENIADREVQISQRYCNLSSINLVEDVGMSNEKENKSTGMELMPPINKNFCEGSGDEGSLSDMDENGSMMSLLSWRRKRKLGFRSPPKRGKPLLNKDYGKDGGDDIDNERRLSGYPIEWYVTMTENKASIEYVDFGDEHFSVGAWERREITSRDGRAKLHTSVFFASIDQRSERADGESACTTLVAVIADWLHKNPNQIPIKAEFDTLIREGSAEWRKLSDLDHYREEFPDRHFDLDTVVKANIRDVVVLQDRSFVGFFKLDGYNFLQTAMSFDDIWEAIEEIAIGSIEPAIYIVSWNDHFFVFKVDKEAYYIIDTLGERLYEGCNEAYILRFDSNTTLVHVPETEKSTCESKGSPSKSDDILPPDTLNPETSVSAPNGVTIGTHLQELGTDRPEYGSDKEGIESNHHEFVSDQQQEQVQSDQQDTSSIGKIKNETVENFSGKDACKHFLKCFFASIPLRELETDMKKGLLEKIPLHKLQIDFHYTSTGQRLDMNGLTLSPEST